MSAARTLWHFAPTRPTPHGAGAAALGLVAALAMTTPALAEDPTPVVAETTAPANPPTQPITPAPTTTVTTEATPSTEAASDFGGSLAIETSVGIGSFVAAPQDNGVVTTSFAPSAYYQIAKDLKLTASLSLTWYQVLDIATPLTEGDALLSDIALGISHGRIFNEPDSKFNLSGSLRVGLPTSLASQFQNRLFTLSSGLTASIPVGPVSFSYSFGFGKYFNLTATPTLNCQEFNNSAECIQGRTANPSFGYESERRGPEVYIAGAGASSFYFQNALNISWAIVDELSLALGLTISNSFGVRSFPQDDLAAAHATSGRAQRDRLMSSLGLDYTFNPHLSVGASLVTDTSAPFGADGNDFPVLFDFTRASDNITSINVSVTGSL